MPSRVDVLDGDMRDVLAKLVADGRRVHAVVTDPPYHLLSTVKRFGNTSISDDTKYSERVRTRADAYANMSRGFMGQVWDGGDIAFRPETWRLCFDLLPPGGHLLAFAGTRTYHRIACAIEDSGFEIRDMMAWLYGSGFPKSHNVAKRLTGDDATAWDGWGTALKPALEPLCIARKPLGGSVAATVLAHGTGALNIDACRIDANDKTPAPVGQFVGSAIGPTGHNGARDNSADALGRWPANVAHDGSREVVEAFPDTTSTRTAGSGVSPIYGDFERKTRGEPIGFGDSGSAARFFYSSKADSDDRLGSAHPTVKPVDLMRWLVRLVTPRGGTVLDPFAGSGTTGMACMAEGFDCVLVEREAAYLTDIRRRIAHVHGLDTPLFGGG
jgi:site-specific DNA-methyltransferase (adenine-specific)